MKLKPGKWMESFRKSVDKVVRTKPWDRSGRGWRTWKADKEGVAVSTLPVLPRAWCRGSLGPGVQLPTCYVTLGKSLLWSSVLSRLACVLC